MEFIYLSVRVYGSEKVVAACDVDVLGKTFDSGRVCLEVSESFYGRKLATLEDLRKALETASIANLTGNKVVSSAVGWGFIDEDKVLVVSGVKHAQMVVL